MIFAAIASDFELGTEPDDSACFFSPSDGFLDVVEIAVEIHRPLIQVTCGHFQQPHLHFSRMTRVPGSETEFRICNQILSWRIRRIEKQDHFRLLYIHREVTAMLDGLKRVIFFLFSGLRDSHGHSHVIRLMWPTISSAN